MTFQTVIDLWNKQADAYNQWGTLSTDEQIEWALECVVQQAEARKDVLLRAAYDILKKCDEGPYVKNALEIVAHYDGAECDGYCLMNDIADELEIHN